MITWVYENGNYVPSAKIIEGQKYSIISDYIGRPIQSFDDDGNLVWSTDYDIYGKLKNLKGNKNFIPFRQLGQYEDDELGGLYYNRFRYYDSKQGNYISKDPIGLAGNNPTLYSYVNDNNVWTDLNGLNPIPSLSDLKDLASNKLDFSTIKDGAVFWSSPNMETAQKWAALNGKTTLEQTVGGKYLDDLNLFGPKSPLSGAEAAGVWDIASKRFADGASGDVNVFSTGAKRYTVHGERTWWRTEKPALLENKDVSSITRRKLDGTIAKNGHVKYK